MPLVVTTLEMLVKNVIQEEQVLDARPHAPSMLTISALRGLQEVMSATKFVEMESTSMLSLLAPHPSQSEVMQGVTMETHTQVMDALIIVRKSKVLPVPIPLELSRLVLTPEPQTMEGMSLPKNVMMDLMEEQSSGLSNETSTSMAALTQESLKTGSSARMAISVVHLSALRSVVMARTWGQIHVMIIMCSHSTDVTRTAK